MPRASVLAARIAKRHQYPLARLNCRGLFSLFPKGKPHGFCQLILNFNKTFSAQATSRFQKNHRAARGASEIVHCAL
jgi:hypothetical protein